MMCDFFLCDKKCPYKKCSVSPSKNHTYIHSKRNLGPLKLYSQAPTNDILLVFEAPGIDEWRKGEPICSKRRGSAGYKFNTELKSQGKIKGNYDIAEAVRCFPGTSTKTTNQKNDIELGRAATFCEKYLSDIILRKNYKKIVCFGESAEKSVESIMARLQCQKHPYYTQLFQSSRVVNLVHPMKNKNLSRDISMYL
jgi:uracil-DNA glycosylase family 4